MSVLFTPLSVGRVHLRNRVAMAPMVQQAGEADGSANEKLAAFYEARAQAGTGLIIVEATSVDAEGCCWSGGLGAYSSEHLDGLGRIANAIRRHDACACLQLVHGGPQALPSLMGGRPGWAPSPVAPNSNYPTPRELPRSALAGIQERFAEAAARAVEAGFQAIELHGAHGYLLDSFLSPDRNRRADEYGGTFPNRMRMLIETFARVRERVGERVLLWCRLSFFNHLHEGLGLAEFRTLLTALASSGCDLLHLSCDGWFRPYFGTERTQGQLAREILRIPVIVAGSLGDAREAERAVAEGHCDVAAVGRAMKSSPDWTARARTRLCASGRAENSPG